MSQLGKKQTEEQKRKRAESNRGRKNTLETIEKMRKAAQGRPSEKCSMFGKNHSGETRLKMSLAQHKTHCKRQHPLDGPEADVHISKSGIRTCRACRRFMRSGTVWNPSNSSIAPQ